jgi:hypothetical protein
MTVRKKSSEADGIGSVLVEAITACCEQNTMRMTGYLYPQMA